MSMTLYNLTRTYDCSTKLSADAALLGEEGYDIVSITTFKDEIVAVYKLSDRQTNAAVSDAMRRGFESKGDDREYA